MLKNMFNIKLTGLVKVGEQLVEAKTHQADECALFKGISPKGAVIYIDHRIEGEPVLITGKGKYPLSWNHNGYYQPDVPIPNGVKIHVTIKKVVAKVIYWA